MRGTKISFPANSINTKLKEKGMRITSRNKKSLIFQKIVLTNSLRKPIKSSLENLYVDIGA